MKMKKMEWADVKFIVIHCSDSPDDRHSVDAMVINDWHQERGFSMIGYHWVITRSGRLQPGRPEFIRGAHAKGYNSKSVGICVAGRDIFTPVQLSRLGRLIKSVMRKYPTAELVGHRELDATKSCPNDMLMDLVKKIRKGLSNLNS